MIGDPPHYAAAGAAAIETKTDDGGNGYMVIVRRPRGLYCMTCNDRLSSRISFVSYLSATRW